MKWFVVVVAGAIGGPTLLYGLHQVRVRRLLAAWHRDHYYGASRAAL
jgi:hypothetical protein